MTNPVTSTENALRPLQYNDGIHTVVTSAGKRRERSARDHLLLFAGALAVPVLIFALVLAWSYVAAERVAAEGRALAAAREAVSAIERELQGPRQVLQALATSELLQAGDIEAFHAAASDITGVLDLTIVLRAPGEARQLLNSRVPWGTPLAGDDTGIAAFEQEAIRTRQPVVTDLTVDAASGLPVVAVIVPVIRSGEVVYLLSAEIPAVLLGGVLEAFDPDPTGFAALVDRNYVVVARSDDHERFVDGPAPADWMAQATGEQGTWAGSNLEGVDVLASYARSAETGWVMAVSVPQHILQASMWRVLLTLAAVGAVLLIAAFALAFWIGSRLSGAIGSLASAGAAVSRGLPMQPVATPVQEVNEVGRALSEAAAQAHRREIHLRSILDTAPNAMVVIDSHGIIQSFSAAAERLFGYTVDEVCGRNVSILMAEPNQSAHDGYIARYLSSGERRIIGKGRVVVGLRKEGTPFPVELQVGEAIIGGERVFTGFLQDQTEKQRMEQELHQVQKIEAIGRLTGGVAHDFNNLLTVIEGNLEMLEARLGGEHRDLLTDVRDAVDLAAQLTRSLLAFGRRMPLSPNMLDVGQLLMGTADLLRRTLGESITVRSTVGSSCRAYVDAAQLQNAILNLGINARDAMPEGGSLTIEVSEAELDEDYASGQPDVRPGKYVVIVVSDTGSGMTEEVKRRAFEPFFTTKPTGQGTGLGLSSVYGFLKQSGGHITLYSEPGQGTTIRIYLPSAADEDGAMRPVASDAPAALPRGHGEKILVAEDDERVRRVTVARLGALGYVVQEAKDGPAALAALQQGPAFDLLFTDMVMPGGLSGAELAAQARRRYLGLRVLFTSGYAEPDAVRQADAESRNWLRKPYTAADLARKLRFIFERENTDS